MTTTVRIPADFIKQLERLQNKYPSVNAEVERLVDQLEQGARPGRLVPNVGYSGVYKERLPNRSARRGKRGGFRVIYYVQVASRVYLLLVYSKTEVDNVPAREIKSVLESVVRRLSK